MATDIEILMKILGKFEHVDERFDKLDGSIAELKIGQARLESSVGRLESRRVILLSRFMSPFSSPLSIPQEARSLAACSREVVESSVSACTSKRYMRYTGIAMVITNANIADIILYCVFIMFWLRSPDPCLQA
jgi:hypothetical protein